MGICPFCESYFLQKSFVHIKLFWQNYSERLNPFDASRVKQVHFSKVNLLFWLQNVWDPTSTECAVTAILLQTSSQCKFKTTLKKI